MPADFLAVDALIHTRESLSTTTEWVQECLTEHYGQEQANGEETLPHPLDDIVGMLSSITDDVTNMAVAVGAYRRREDGALMRPRCYSTNHSVYIHREIGSPGEEITATCLQHPSGQQHNVMVDEARRDGVTSIQGGADNE